MIDSRVVRRSRSMFLVLAVALALGMLGFPAHAGADDAPAKQGAPKAQLPSPRRGQPGGEAPTPTRYGMSLEFGNTYDPSVHTSFLLATGFALFDYGAVWRQDRPRELRFKVEAAAGGMVRPDVRALASVGMLALYYLDGIAGKQYRPYVEGGIGAVYADFRVPGQGLRFNFNPQLGIGAEWGRDEGSNFFTTLRLHHISNAGLHDDNRGMNSLVLQVGRFF